MIMLFVLSAVSKPSFVSPVVQKSNTIGLVAAVSSSTLNETPRTSGSSAVKLMNNPTGLGPKSSNVVNNPCNGALFAMFKNVVNANSPNNVVQSVESQPEPPMPAPIVTRALPFPQSESNPRPVLPAR